MTLPGRPDELESLSVDPLEAFAAWLEDARASGLREPMAMALATTSTEGGPDVRVVLLRGLDADGLRFFTNRLSPKGRDLAADPRAAAVFHWEPLERQVRVRGRVDLLDDASSAAYWRTRPVGSRIAAWASEQSAPVAGREALEQRVADMRRRFADGEVPLPPFWGGYVLHPERWEFWRGRRDRLHDRLRYERRAEGWERVRLAP